MRKYYDFSKGEKNPFAAKLKKQISIRLNPAVLGYFKRQAQDTDIPYQQLINLYLADCVKQERTIDLSWKNNQEKKFFTHKV